MGFPWPPAAATGVGSYPGVDPVAALRVVLDELPDLPHLPELPARGPGADLVGRALALLAGLPAEVHPTGWRLSDRPGRDLRRAQGFLRHDLDALEELAGDYQGPLKIQVAGPWTLAGAVELRNGNKLLADPGAVRDLVDALAEGVAAHLADVRRRVPGADVLVQLDEPGLPGVLAGGVPTASGFSRLPAVEEPVATERLRQVVAAAGPHPILHCCAPDVPYALARAAGVRAVSVDARFLGPAADEALGEAVEAGIGVIAGVVPATDAPLASVERAAAPVRELWRRLGQPAGSLAATVVTSPACGLAGASEAYVIAALTRCREVAKLLRDDPGN